MQLSLKRVLSPLFLLVFMLINCQKGISQEWNSARLTVLYGSSIPFNFNSLDRFKKGIEVLSGTQFGISMADSSKVGHTLEGFVLNFRSFNSQPNIKGDVYTLPLNTLRVKAESAMGLETGISSGYKDLTTDWVPLFTYNIISGPWIPLNWANNQLRISFECGKPVVESGKKSLLGAESDYYNVEVEFELVPIGPGF
jgi:hypothetical protein